MFHFLHEGSKTNKQTNKLYTSQINLTPPLKHVGNIAYPRGKKKENAEKYKKTRNANFFTSSKCSCQKKLSRSLTIASFRRYHVLGS